MKTFFKVAISTILLAPFLVVGTVMAVEDSTGAPTEDNSNKTNTKPTELRAETEEQAKARLEAAMKERIEKRKAELKIRLNAAEKTRLAQRCKPSQSIIKNLGDKVNANVPRRYKAYEALNEHLTTLISKLESKGIAANELITYQTVLMEKINNFQGTMVTYQQALSDLNAINCAADPDAFKASLEAARKLREDLTKSAADIQTYVKETIKPGLVVIRQQLEPKNTTEGGN